MVAASMELFYLSVYDVFIPSLEVRAKFTEVKKEKGDEKRSGLEGN